MSEIFNNFDVYTVSLSLVVTFITVTKVRKSCYFLYTFLIKICTGYCFHAITNALTIFYAILFHIAINILNFLGNWFETSIILNQFRVQYVQSKL